MTSGRGAVPAGCPGDRRPGSDPAASLPIYIAALVCTAIAFAVLPLMKRLSDEHHGHRAAE